MEVLTATGIIALLVGVLGWLLANKDAKQADEIEDLRATCRLLFKKHDDDVAALVLLQRQIDKEHYIKPELDARFQSLESTFREGFNGLRAEFKELARVLVDHVTKEGRQ